MLAIRLEAHKSVHTTTARRVLTGALMAAILMAFPRSSAAQFGSSVQGVVQDPSGGNVASATVTLLNDATHVRQDTRTDNSGNYRFVSLAPGSYTISAEAAGFYQDERHGQC